MYGVFITSYDEKMTNINILIKERDMKKIQSTLEQLLDIQFENRESSYWGEYCICKKLNTMKSIQIQYNYVDEDWQFEEFKDCPIVVNLNDILEGDDSFRKILDNVNSIERVFINEVKYNAYHRKYIYQDGRKELIWEK